MATVTSFRLVQQVGQHIVHRVLQFFKQIMVRVRVKFTVRVRIRDRVRVSVKVCLSSLYQLVLQHSSRAADTSHLTVDLQLVSVMPQPGALPTSCPDLDPGLGIPFAAG